MKIKTVGVVGAGQMDNGIAQAAIARLRRAMAVPAKAGIQ